MKWQVRKKVLGKCLWIDFQGLLFVYCAKLTKYVTMMVLFQWHLHLSHLPFGQCQWLWWAFGNTLCPRPHYKWYQVMSWCTQNHQNNTCSTKHERRDILHLRLHTIFTWSSIENRKSTRFSRWLDKITKGECERRNSFVFFIFCFIILLLNARCCSCYCSVQSQSFQCLSILRVDANSI